jgi:hypothetical protein
MALAAVAGLAITSFSPDAGAAVITLTGSTGNSCSYSSMAVAPDGSFNVTCSAPTGTPTCQQLGNCVYAGAFAFSQSTASAPVNASLALFISRTGGTTGVVNVPITFTGSCTYQGAASVTATFADGQTLLGFYANTTTDGACTVGFGSPSMVSGTVDVQPTVSGSVAVTVGTGGNTNNGGGGGTVTGQCPTGFTTPTDLITNLTLGGIGNPLMAMAHSGQTISIPLPAVQPGVSSGAIVFSESAGGAYTPNPVTLDISINKCQGQIDTDQTNACNYHTTNGNYSTVQWLGKAYGALTNAATANPRGLCWAGDASTQYYINARWSYSQCAFGAQTCGFAVQQNYGPY